MFLSTNICIGLCKYIAEQTKYLFASFKFGGSVLQLISCPSWNEDAD